MTDDLQVDHHVESDKSFRLHNGKAPNGTGKLGEDWGMVLEGFTSGNIAKT